MYNEKCKQDYINALTSKQNRAIYFGLFDKLEQLENREETDLYNLPKDIIAVEMLNKARISSYNTFYRRMADINKYKRWALVNNLIDEESKVFVDAACDLRQIFQDNVKDEQIFRSPKELMECLNSLFDKRHDKGITFDELIIAYMVLTYQGIEPKEVFKLKLSDMIVSETNIAINTGKEIIILYDEFYDIIFKIYKNRLLVNLAHMSEKISEMGEYFIDTCQGFDFDKLHSNFMSIIVKQNSLKFYVKPNEIFFMGRIYKFIITHNIKEDKIEKKLFKFLYPEKSNPSSYQRNRAKSMFQKFIK